MILYSQVLYQTLRAQIPIPILVLYANAGAVENNGVTKRNTDDVLNEVFDMGSSIAQAKSYIERYTRQAGKNDRAYIIACGQDLVIDPNERAVYLCGENLNLSQKQFDLLFCLASHPGQVLSKEQLFNYLWGEPDVEVNNSIVLYISKLRKKLGENPNAPEYIQTVRGIGYRFTKV